MVGYKRLTMKQLSIIICLLISKITFGQVTDSVVTHLPNTIPCAKVDYYVDNILKGTNTTKSSTLKLNHTKFGMTVEKSELVGYSKINSKQNIRIVPGGCTAEVKIYRHIFQTGSLNE